MIYFTLASIIIVSAIFYAMARSKSSKTDIVIFSLVAAGMFICIALINSALADEPEFYVGAEFGVDQPYGADPSPQCQQGYQDQWTSNGRAYAGVEYQNFYVELSPWIHKSCAAGEDDQVTDSFGFVIGAKIKFKL